MTHVERGTEREARRKNRQRGAEQAALRAHGAAQGAQSADTRKPQQGRATADLNSSALLKINAGNRNPIKQAVLQRGHRHTRSNMTSAAILDTNISS